MGYSIPGGYIIPSSSWVMPGYTITPGTSCVQTLTFGGSPSAGASSTFRLAFDGYTTAPILWSATNATLVGNIDSALEALSSIGTGAVTTAVGSMTNGVGTITCTFAGTRAARVVPAITVADNSMTGTSPTLVAAVTTPGVDATIAAS
jgi:hypothetical protein